ncbi:membrane lipoprotein lipid attachment site-containing protein [Rufibacter roseus]|uniref:Membrane lipoprotein lipid attachment site-containing protein n=1 Tax=Rufibacter roseus TaxID=1567108 RepID=A0ABW2DI74_9BACT|nr:membrane lipoprotein lipid attachment site-containing protein [Rufibacter roseus]
MKKIAFLFCSVLALASCNQDSNTAQTEQETKLEETAAEVYEDAQELGSPDPAAPTTNDFGSDPEETLPGATSTASSSPTNANPLFNYTLQQKQAGAVKIGMTIKELRKQYGENKLREIEHMQEGMTTIAYEVLGERKRTDLRVEQECTGDACHVWRITVLNPAYKTAEGIGIGSTFGELKNNINITQVTPGEEHFVAIAGKAGMSFFLDLGDIPAERWSKLKIKDVPNSATVTGVLIY